jgi:aconitate hydratase
MTIYDAAIKYQAEKVPLILSGRESYLIESIAEGMAAGKPFTVRAKRNDGSECVFTAMTRIETPDEVAYHRHGGILPYVLRQLLRS